MLQRIFRFSKEATANSSVRLPVVLHISCEYGSYLFDSLTNLGTRDHLLNDTVMFGACFAFGVTEPVLYASRFKVGITVRVPGFANIATEYSFNPTFADSQCSVYAFDSALDRAFGSSPTVTFYLEPPPTPIPTYLEADLSGWQGGSSVYLTAVSDNGNTFSLQLNIKCPVSSQSFAIHANTLETLLLDEWLSGIGCVISTSNVPDPYAPITPVALMLTWGQLLKL